MTEPPRLHVGSIMAARTLIEWTELTWNPVTGCTKISPGCTNCYAERMAKRLKAIGAARYRAGFTLQTHDAALDEPLRWKSRRKVFVNSMSDLFHKDVPLTFIQRAFDVMARCPHHQFQILTKRAARLRQLAPALNWAPNIWMGVSVEDQKRARRAVDLCSVPAHIRFLSVEPLLGPIDELPLDGIHLGVVGGESGPDVALKAIAKQAVSQLQVSVPPLRRAQSLFRNVGGYEQGPTFSE